ncbi:hypothetical protein ACJIZ3_002590 [Penstemon smallii]|uniref:Uncharacterized protein n=1 Tax=Penstemon smallii TaxID=265156 RepID=A0ABD3U803_9LAMI
MNTPPKHPIFCLKWPWDNHPPPSRLNNNSCSLETPWLFKSFKNLGTLTFNFINSAVSPKSQNNPFQLSSGIKQERKILSPDEQGEAEQRAFAAALASFAIRCWVLCWRLKIGIPIGLTLSWLMQKMITGCLSFSIMTLSMFHALSY